ncbi:MAG: carboxysome shell protein [Thiomicrospira sp.]|uniref:CsoS2 family carboxysome shell protein n=1 Tax=Thiomicrospira sp. TaxID=935 RepID=UPI001A0DE037|nr:CsoS2 family carboxysome shell protein [Thiomicrospira sp.]MBE0492862.1 carboxysome shell protein [Thiomicrospira sp.]
MSDNTQALTGRAVARARRQALTKGKGAKIDYAAAAQSTSAPVKSSAPERSEETLAPSSRNRSRDIIVQQPVMTDGRKASLERRKQQVKGKSSRGGAQPTRQPRKTAEVAVETTPVDTAQTAEHDQAAPSSANRNRSKVNAVKPVAATQSKGRLVARAYRKAACEGKAKLQAKMSQNSALTCISTAESGASCREIARQVREQRATHGKVKATSSQRPAGRMSKKSESSAPEKVGIAKTSYDQDVSGTLVSNTKKMTGSEAGSCRVISGTEYTGPEEYQAKCSFKPEPNPRKVALTTTASGLGVSGTEVGFSKSVTGTESGQCRSVTGTEYLPADQGEMFCGSRPEAGPSKVSQSKTVRNQVVSGPSLNTRQDMTGMEAGAQRAVTGSQYVSSSAPMGKEPTRQARDQVMSRSDKHDVSHTSGGSQVSGTNVNFYKPVTGDESGFCKNVTGGQYQSQEVRQERCEDTLPPTPTKTIQSQTFAGQKITGDRAGLGGKITGAAAGNCKSVTGSSYLSFDAVESCGVEPSTLKPDANKFTPRSGPATGGQPSPLGLTGAQKGVCSPVSGTPYQGLDQTSAMCQSSMPSMAGESDYPTIIMASPQPMMAQPATMAAGAYSAAIAHPVPIMIGSEQHNEADQVVASRITGDGADSGYSITGDSWKGDGKVSGTDGKKRNVSMRGVETRQTMGARDFRPVSNPQVADISSITGSSGNTSSGASVTVSGGARA